MCYKRGDEIIDLIMYSVSVFLAINSIFPPMRAIPSIIFITFILMFLWILLAFIRNPNFFIKMPIHGFVTFLFILYTFLIPYMMGNATIGNRYLSIAQIFIFHIMYIFYRAHGKQKYNIGIIKWVIPFVLYTTIQTGIALATNPWISRSIKSSGEYSTQVSLQGIGGYGLIYFLVFCSIILFYIFFIYKKEFISTKTRVMCFMFFILFNFVIIISNYFSAFIINLASIALLLFIKLTKEPDALKQALGISSLLLVVAFFKRILLFSLNIGIAILNEGKTLDRLTAFYQQLQFGYDSELIAGRSVTLYDSLQTIFNNPVFGLIVKKIEFDVEGYLIGFGQHSHILDTCALFGIFVGIAQIYILFQPYRIRIKNYGSKDLSIILMIAMMTLLFMNNVTASIGLVLFLIFPTLHDELEKKKVSVR